MRRVELEWDGELEVRLREIGRIRIIGQLDYKKKGGPVMTAFEHNEYQLAEARVFSYPCSLTIETHSKYIYICDSGNNRVQVYSDYLEFIFYFSEKMNGPNGISIHEKKVYVTQYVSNLLNVYSIEGDLLQSVGRKGDGELEFDSPFGVEVSTMKNLIYVVLKGGYHCICLFNYSHQFVREMIRCGEGTPLTNPHFFGLDQQNNILMTDYLSHCIAIFSMRGELVHKFSKERENRGQQQYPTGITMNSGNKIVVISENPNNCMQIF